MTDLISTLGNLVASLGNVQSAGVLREHVALIKSNLELIKERVVSLEKENAELIKQKAQLEKELSRYRIPDQFVEHRGALFKRKAGGGYVDHPICPVCHSAMFSFENLFPFECGNRSCGQTAGFTGNELSRILSELPST